MPHSGQAGMFLSLTISLHSYNFHFLYISFPVIISLSRFCFFILIFTFSYTLSLSFHNPFTCLCQITITTNYFQISWLALDPSIQPRIPAKHEIIYSHFWVLLELKVAWIFWVALRADYLARS